jgi:hypothetical protein
MGVSTCAPRGVYRLQADGAHSPLNRSHVCICADAAPQALAGSRGAGGDAEAEALEALMAALAAAADAAAAAAAAAEHEQERGQQQEQEQEQEHEQEQGSYEPHHSLGGGSAEAARLRMDAGASPTRRRGATSPG